MTNKNSDNDNIFKLFFMFFKKYWQLFLYFFSILGFMIFYKLSTAFSNSSFYYNFNFILFYTSLLIIVVLFSVYIINKIIFSFKNKLFKEIIEFGFISLVSLYVLMFRIKQGLYGRFLLLDMFLNSPQNRSFSSLLYIAINNIFDVKLNIDIILIVNFIYSFLLLLILFYISKYFFKNFYLSFLTILIFISSRFVQANFYTIEHTIGSVFYVYLALFGVILFNKNKTNKYSFLFLITSMLAVLMASFYRYELSFLLGFPYLIYISFFIKKDTRILKILFSIFVILLSLRVLGIVTHYSNNDDYWLMKYTDGKGLTAVTRNFFLILHDNLFVEKQLSLNSGYSTLFDYYFIIIIFIIGMLILFKKKILKFNHNEIYLCLLYGSVFLLFQLALHREGLMSGDKYSVSYFFCEIVVFIYLFKSFIDYLFFKIKNLLQNKLAVKKYIFTIKSLIFLTFLIIYLIIIILIYRNNILSLGFSSIFKLFNILVILSIIVINIINFYLKIDKLNLDKLKSIFSSVSLVLLILVVFFIPGPISVKNFNKIYMYYDNIYSNEYFYFKNYYDNSWNYSCKLITYRESQPLMMYYYDYKIPKTKFSTNLTSFYHSIDYLDKTNSCYYHLDEKMYLFANENETIVNDLFFENQAVIDINKIDESFKNCNKTIESSFPVLLKYHDSGKVVNLTKDLIKYDCNNK